jgi:outer membrane receptor protein involved in Fe transport
MIYNIGLFRRLREDIDVRVEGYYNDTDDYISSESHSYPRISYSDNIDKVWTKGAEMEFNRCAASGIGVYFNYNFYIVDWHDDSLEIEPFLMELTPRHQFNLSLMYWLLKDTRILTSARAAIGRHSKFGLEMADYFVVNAGIDQRLFNSRLSIDLGVENILNADYQEIYGYPMPGRTFTLHMNYSL